MSKLIELWLDQTDDQKLEFENIMLNDLNEIKFCRTHRIVGNEETNESFIVPCIWGRI